MPALGYVWRSDWQGNFSTKHLRARWNIFVLIKAKLGSNDPSLFIDHFLSFPLRFGQISRIVSSLEDSDWPVRQLFYICATWPSLFIKHFMDVQLLHMRNQIQIDRERVESERGMNNCKD